VVDGSEPPEGWLGKPWALQQGGERAAGELLLFVDSDIDYDPHTIGSVLAFWEKERPSFLALLPHITMRGFWERLLMPQLAIIALGTLPLWMAPRTRTRHLAIGGGTGNLITRDAWERLGGHRRLRNAVVDDVGLARQVRGVLGEPAVALRAEAFVSVRMYEGLGQIVQGFSKNAFSIFGGSLAGALLAVLLAFVTQILPYLLALSGAARWLASGVVTPVEAVSILTVGLISVTRLILFGSLGYSLLHALFSLPLSMTVWLGIVLRSTWLNGIRRELSWRGRTYHMRPTTFGDEAPPARSGQAMSRK
jgi:chlorobactene glucosyltransferase